MCWSTHHFVHYHPVVGTHTEPSGTHDDDSGVLDSDETKMKWRSWTKNRMWRGRGRGRERERERER